MACYDQVSTCECCALIHHGDMGDQYLVTDGAIYCPQCAGDVIRDGIEDALDKLAPASESYYPFVYPGPDKRGIDEIFPDWSIRLHHRTILEIFDDPDMWDQIEVQQYNKEVISYNGDPSTLATADFYASLAGRDFFTVQGLYSWEKTIVVKIKDETETEEN